ncbi:MAG: hypothetical protein KatS3mg123_2807 [Burkholderiales bacterium]|nr:MAG: hypothetical protein KatS3mg123_2807 [Burkholderiales bacterium]
MQASLLEPPLTATFRARGVPLDPFGPRLFVPRHFGDPLAEQRATRTSAGLYDFSFMACFEARGPEALSFLQRLQTRDLEGLAPGRLAYTLLLREDGSVFIDATVWRIGEAHYWIVTGRRSDIDHVGRVAADFDVQIQDRSGRDAVIALQGPACAALLRQCGAGPLPDYFGFVETCVLGKLCRVARIGYTGELGYEIFVDGAATKALWEGLVDAGRSAGLAECGFAAADASAGGGRDSSSFHSGAGASRHSLRSSASAGCSRPVSATWARPPSPVARRGKDWQGFCPSRVSRRRCWLSTRPWGRPRPAAPC